MVDVNSVINLVATMSQMCKLVDGGEGTSQQVKQTAAAASPVTDWTLCVLCQSERSEKLINPSQDKFKSSEKECGYKVTAEHISEFQKLGCVPLGINIMRLDDGDGIEKTLQKNNGAWHKTCRNKFDKQKLQRAQKRKAKDDMEPKPSPVKTRLSR